MEKILGGQDGEARLFWEAFSFAVDAHQDQSRKSGEAYVSHPCEVSRILVEELGVKLPAATFEADEPVVAEPHSPSDESSPELPAEPTNAEGETLDPTGTADN